MYIQQDKKYYPTAEEVYGPEVEVQRLLIATKCLVYILTNYVRLLPASASYIPVLMPMFGKFSV